MGFYKFYCKKCDHEVEGRCNHDELDQQICGAKDYWGRPAFWFDDEAMTGLEEGCGNVMKRVWRPQEMSFNIAGKSLDTHGVTNANGYYSPSFNRYFKNSYACHEYAEANGYKAVSQAYADDRLQEQYERLQKQDKVGDTYGQALKDSGGDKVKAAVETFVPSDMRDK